jgi:hypothetical protein
MTDIAAETNKLIRPVAQSAAAVLLVGTNFFLTPSQASWADTSNAYSYEQVTDGPLAALTTGTTSASASRFVSASTLTPWVIAPRWQRYVSRRLAALRLGAFDFTGLQIPTPWIVDRASIVAKAYLHPDTPPPSVVPTKDGDILFIWRKAGWDLQIEIGSEGTTAWAYHRGSGAEWSGSLEERQAELSQVLATMSQD